MEINIGLTNEQRAAASEILQKALADQHVLYIKLRNFHWNLKGSRFNSLHTFFEAQYDALALAIDETAERIRTLDGVAAGSMSEFLSNARLSEHKGEVIDGDDAIESLLADHEAVSTQLRKDIAQCEELSEVGTADFLTGQLQAHEKAAWMLRSFKEE